MNDLATPSVAQSCIGHYFTPTDDGAACFRCGETVRHTQYLCPDDRDRLTRALGRFRCPTCGRWFWRHGRNWRSRGRFSPPIPEPDVAFGAAL